MLFVGTCVSPRVEPHWLFLYGTLENAIGAYRAAAVTPSGRWVPPPISSRVEKPRSPPLRGFSHYGGRNPESCPAVLCSCHVTTSAFAQTSLSPIGGIPHPITGVPNPVTHFSVTPSTRPTPQSIRPTARTDR